MVFWAFSPILSEDKTSQFRPLRTLWLIVETLTQHFFSRFKKAVNFCFIIIDVS